MTEKVTYWVQSLFLQLCFLQIIAFFSHAEQPPTLADLFVDFRLREVRKLLLYFQVNIIIVEEVSRSERQQTEKLMSFYSNYKKEKHKVLHWFKVKLQACEIHFYM